MKSHASNAGELLSQYKGQVDVLLAEFFSKKREVYRQYGKEVAKLFENVEDFTLRGGKRLRPALIYYSYSLFSTAGKESVISISIFMELIQSFLLIHDDIMDRSSLRRSSPTIHKIYESDTTFVRDPIHSGNAMAILAGDFACQLAYEIIGEAKIESEKKVKILNATSEKISQVIFGQVLDYYLPFKSAPMEEDVVRIDIYKTATYTYELPILIGAILAGVTDKRLDILKEFSCNAGVAFQIRDDVLGVFGDDVKTGKPSVSDIGEGKITLLVLEAYKKADPIQKAKLDKYLGKHDLTEEELEVVKAIIIKTGSLEYSKIACSKFVTRAQYFLNQLNTGTDNLGWQFLNSIVEEMTIREF